VCTLASDPIIFIGYLSLQLADCVRDKAWANCAELLCCRCSELTADDEGNDDCTKMDESTAVQVDIEFENSVEGGGYGYSDAVETSNCLAEDLYFSYAEALTAVNAWVQAREGLADATAIIKILDTYKMDAVKRKVGQIKVRTQNTVAPDV
jgi:hypothetical protein